MALTVSSHKAEKQSINIWDSTKRRSSGIQSSTKTFVPISPCHGPNTVGLSSKEESVLGVVGVEERKLAIRIDNIEKQSERHFKSLQREEKALKELRRDLRKHAMLDGFPSKPSNKLNLPPICTGDHQVGLQRKSLSASSSPVTQRRYMHKGSYSLDKSNTAWTDDTIKSRSTDDSPSKERYAFKIGRDFKSMPNGLNRHRNLHMNFSSGAPAPVITVEQVTDDGICNTRQEKRTIPVWELGLIPTYDWTPGELMSVDKHQKSLNKSSQKAALDPRFQRLESALIPCGRKPLIMPRPSNPTSCVSANDGRKLQDDVRVTRSAPSSPRGHRKHFEGDGFHLMPTPPPSGQRSALMPRPPTPNRLLSANNGKELHDDNRITRSAPSSPRGLRKHFVGDGFHLMPTPPTSGQRSAAGSPLRRPRIVIGQQLDDAISQPRREDEKNENEDESIMFDFTRLSPDPIIVMSPPPSDHHHLRP